ncbi:hypothetical protein TNCV_400041 [Trichonephila clavipes]|nr:hypothetical protein TNCV_400041 [Trichonephila clavipes]
MATGSYMTPIYSPSQRERAPQFEKRCLRRIDDLEKDLLVLRTKNWRTLAGRRMTWKGLLEKAKAHPGLSSL